MSPNDLLLIVPAAAVAPAAALEPAAVALFAAISAKTTGFLCVEEKARNY